MAVAAGLLSPVVAFVPHASINVARARTAPTSSTSALSASSLRMGEEPLGVGVIGCGRIGDVSRGAVLLSVAKLWVWWLSRSVLVWAVGLE